MLELVQDGHERQRGELTVKPEMESAIEELLEAKKQDVLRILQGRPRLLSRARLANVANLRGAERPLQVRTRPDTASEHREQRPECQREK